MTLNMMKVSRVHPILSAYQELYGAFNFEKNPLAPIGKGHSARETNGKKVIDNTWSGRVVPWTGNEILQVPFYIHDKNQ